ncbi:tetratricopeptide repeat protein [Streptomyces paromomycinus]|uniref:Transcriptional regulator n=1 Tax=Streptomyces paromomycinus TaxID=92743 RepID=A0A401W3U8_STREY|nr:tetratricopeptide repeat protein [Streptomyces paromomycinus]GCD44003.1 transcriptional regulator [Streptomyces paromomycinus]
MTTSNKIDDGIFFSAVIQGHTITVELPPSITPALSGLPLRSRTYVGRSRELSSLLDQLDPSRSHQNTARFAAVVGMAGVGKTELALQAAAEAEKRTGWFPGGILFINLFGYDNERYISPEQALGSLLIALGIPGEQIPPDLADRTRLYRSILSAYASRGKHILIVIDNASSDGQVEPLLPSHDDGTAIVTSRHSLAVGARILDLDVLEPSASVELVRRVLFQARGENDSRVAQEQEKARALVELCGNLPLALQICASLLADSPSRPISSLVQALFAAHTRLDRLKREDRAVRAAFELSYLQLSADPARILRLLPLNPGPDISSRAAAHLTGDPNIEVILEDLARAHLIEPGTTWGRWRLHDLLRLYADEKGKEHAELDERQFSLERVLYFYLMGATSANLILKERNGRGEDEVDALEWLEEERSNLVAAAQTGHEIGVDLAFALDEFFHLRRYFDDWLAVIDSALKALRIRGDLHREGWALATLALVLYHVRRFDEALEIGKAAIDICRRSGNRYGEQAALNALSQSLYHLGEYRDSVDAGRKAAEILHELNDPQAAKALGSLALALQELDIQEAIQLHRDAVSDCQAREDRQGEAAMRNLLGMALRKSGEFTEAAQEHWAAATLYQEVGDHHGEAAALGSYGLALQDAGRYAEAIHAHSQDVRLCEETGDRHALAEALDNLALAHRRAGQVDNAVVIYRQAAEIFQEVEDLSMEGLAIGGSGRAFEEAGRLGEAIEAYRDAVQSFRNANDRENLLMALETLGITLLKGGFSEESDKVRQEFMTLASALDAC